MIVNVTIEDRPDGGVNVHSEDLAGLILSGKNRIAIIKAIEPAARAILEHRGLDGTEKPCSQMWEDRKMAGECACKSPDRYDCWSIRYKGHICFSSRDIERDGGPCECSCHEDLGDYEDEVIPLPERGSQ